MAVPSVLRRFDSARVLVVGDVMLDEYLWGAVDRISPEAPVPVVQMEKQTNHLGGAANVAANIRALGGRCLTVGLIGEDTPAQELKALFRAKGLPISGLLECPGIPTVRKVRIIGHRQQLLRVDFENAGACGDMTEALIARVRRDLGRHGSVVISDYGKGVISPELIRELIRACLRKGIRIVVDPKVEHFGLYENVDIITPNHHEAGQACGIDIVDEGTLHSAGQRILELTSAQAVLITRGPEGMSLFRRRRRPVHIRTDAREVYDVSGAGDTVVATLALALAAGQDLEVSSRLANRAAGIVVGKLGTATVSPQELADSLRRRPLPKRRR